MPLRRALALACIAVLAAAHGAGAAGPRTDLGAAVAMGDSYSSGEGAGPFDPGTNVGRDRCHRSALAWPRLLGVPAARHIACSGSTLASLTAGEASLAPDDVGQLTRLAALAGTTHVLVTLGGNDADFAAVLTRCVLGSCVAAARAGTAALPALAPRLEAAYREIAAAAPGARVLVVGYPRIVPAGAPRAGRCPWLGRREIPAARGFLDALDHTIRIAAARAGAEYVATGDALRGHELCTPRSWVVPIHLDPLSTDPRQGHPRPAGQAALARRVGAYLDVNPVAP